MSCNKIQKGDLDAFVHGELSAVETEELEAYLFGCEFCATELQQLRKEKRLFQLRAEADEEQVPAFAEVLARINREEAATVTNEEESNRVIVLAKAPRPWPSKAKAEDDHAIDEAVQADIAEARRVKVVGTPTFFVNGRRLIGAQAIDVFRKQVDAALAH